jgi:predicted peroxiredoxin
LSENQGKTILMCNHADGSGVFPTLIMGSSAASLGDEILIFFCPGGAQALVKGELEKFCNTKGLPDPVELYNTIRELGGRMIICELAFEAKGIDKNNLRDGVEVMNAPGFLLEAQGATMSLVF